MTGAGSPARTRRRHRPRASPSDRADPPAAGRGSAVAAAAIARRRRDRAIRDGRRRRRRPAAVAVAAPRRRGRRRATARWRGDGVRDVGGRPQRPAAPRQSRRRPAPRPPARRLARATGLVGVLVLGDRAEDRQARRGRERPGRRVPGHDRQAAVADEGLARRAAGSSSARSRSGSRTGRRARPASPSSRADPRRRRRDLVVDVEVDDARCHAL